MVMLPRLVERFCDDRPDLILYDIGGQAAPVLSARLGLPAVLLAPTWVPWDGSEQEMAVALDALRQSPDGKSYHAAFTAWLRDNGIEQDAWDWMRGGNDIISLIPRAMQPFADRVPESVRYVGPCLEPARLADRTWTPPDNGRRVLLVSLGTVFNDRPDLYRACIEAFADSDWQVVMAVGQRVDPAGLGPIPANIDVYKTVPQLTVLAAASAFITHAGMGSCVESLWFGVPTVSMPLAAEQFGNAAVLAALGVGQQLNAHAVSPAALAARLTAVQTDVRTHGGIEYAADTVESFLP
jgi:MGT family glycosyltransferase